MGIRKPWRSDGRLASVTWVLVALMFAFGCQVDPLAPGVEGPVAGAKPDGVGNGNGNGGGNGDDGGDGGIPNGSDLVFTIHDVPGGIESDGDNTYYPADDPDIEAYIDDGKAVLFTNAGKKSGKNRDPERSIRMTMTDGVGALIFDQDSVEIAAQTTSEVHIVDDLEPGETADIQVRMIFQANNTGYYLRFGRECVSNVPVPEERAQITRLDESSWVLQSLPDRTARLCTSDFNDLVGDVSAHFHWEFSIAGGG